ACNEIEGNHRCGQKQPDYDRVGEEEQLPAYNDQERIEAEPKDSPEFSTVEVLAVNSDLGVEPICKSDQANQPDEIRHESDCCQSKYSVAVQYQPDYHHASQDDSDRRDGGINIVPLVATNHSDENGGRESNGQIHASHYHDCSRDRGAEGRTKDPVE